jgi:hypothetical protein
MRTDFDWNDGKYVPDDSCYCLCEMENMPYSKYAVLRWDGEYWLLWSTFSIGIAGWMGVPDGMTIKRWCVIEYE